MAAFGTRSSYAGSFAPCQICGALAGMGVGSAEDQHLRDAPCTGTPAPSAPCAAGAPATRSPTIPHPPQTRAPPFVVAALAAPSPVPMPASPGTPYAPSFLAPSTAITAAACATLSTACRTIAVARAVGSPRPTAAASTAATTSTQQAPKRSRRLRPRRQAPHRALPLAPPTDGVRVPLFSKVTELRSLTWLGRRGRPARGFRKEITR